MLDVLSSILRDPVPYRGALGFFAVITLDKLNAAVGLLVGLATLVYLCLRIRREIAASSSRTQGQRNCQNDSES